MINQNLNSAVEFFDFVPATETRGNLHILIRVYDEPVMQSDEKQIYSVIIIDEEEPDGNLKPFGGQVYEIKATKEQAEEAFANIRKDPDKFKTPQQ